MAKFTRIQVALKMMETGLIPVFYHPDLEVCKNVVKSCYDAGLKLMEFTNRGDFAHEVFSELNKYVLKTFPDMIMGVGSICDAATATLYIQSGTNFVVGPMLDEETAKACNRRKILWSPCCGSVTEIQKAHELGAEIVKIFPAAQVGGPKFVEMVKGPCPWTTIMPTGGVEPKEDNLTAWFKAGVACVGMGSNLISKECIDTKNWTKLTSEIKTVLDLVQKVKKQ